MEPKEMSSCLKKGPMCDQTLNNLEVQWHDSPAQKFKYSTIDHQIKKYSNNQQLIIIPRSSHTETTVIKPSSTPRLQEE